MPDGKPLRSEFYFYAKDGKLEASRIVTDSGWVTIDSFYYNKKGKFSEIKSFVKPTKSDTIALSFHLLSFVNDSTGKLKQVLYFADGKKDTLPNLVYTYNYSKNGKLASIFAPVYIDSSNIDTLFYEFDKFEKLTKKRNKLSRTEYKYDGSGNITEQKDINGLDISTIKYSYNKLGQIVKTVESTTGKNRVSESLFSMKSFMILTKTKFDKGAKGLETYQVTIRQYEFYK
jgi:YD repeat-containing protein